MSLNNSALDISVLRSNPTEFLLGCQRIIQICVRQYIASDMFRVEDEQDMIQSINEELIVKLPIIEAQYNGMAQMQTYMNAIIQNICLKIYRESHKAVKTAPLEAAASHLSNDPSNEIIIYQEIQRLRVVLELLYGKKQRVLFFVRLYLGIHMKGIDVRDIISKVTTYDRQIVSETILQNYNTLSVAQRFEQFAVFFNKYRKRTTISGAGLQRFAERHVNILIRLLNGNPPLRAYTEESLKVLIEEYYIREFENN